MPRKYITIFFLLILTQVIFGQTIMQIQQTDVPGADNTYPSTYVGQEVTISPATIGAKGFNGSENNLFVYDLNPGPWNGIYLNNATNSANLKAMVSVTGTVAENNGMTELVNATITTINPGPIDVTANLTTIPVLLDNATAEQFESSLVQLNNVICSEIIDANFWYATDGSGNEIKIGSGFYATNPLTGDEYGSISGVLVYTGSEFVIHPRNAADLIPSSPATLGINTEYEKIGDKFYVHINSTNIKDYWQINGFAFDFNFTSDLLIFNSTKIGDVYADDQQAELEIDEANHKIKYRPLEPFGNFETPRLISLIFDIKEFGVARVNFTRFAFFDEMGVTWSIANPTVANITYNNIYNAKKAYLSIKNDNNDKNIFNPYHNERLTLKYGFKNGVSTKTIVRIYDLKGRLVYTPVNKIVNGLEEFRWDGRDKNRELVDIGTYICQVEVVIRATGDKYTTDQPIVVAGKLK